MPRLLTCVLASFLLVGCQKSAGESCETSGDGFTGTDPCEHTCVDWAITCDHGPVNPDVCSGGACSADADCDAGFVCLQVDSFNSECLPSDTCD